MKRENWKYVMRDGHINGGDIEYKKLKDCAYLIMVEIGNNP